MQPRPCSRSGWLLAVGCRLSATASSDCTPYGPTCSPCARWPYSSTYLHLTVKSGGPRWIPCETIGAWKTVLSAMSVVAVVTNATMICFVSSTLADPAQPEEVLPLWFLPPACLQLCTDTVVGLVPFEPPHAPKRQAETIVKRLESVRLWVYAVLIEHSVMLLLFALETVAPTIPLWVKEAKETLDDSLSQVCLSVCALSISACAVACVASSAVQYSRGQACRADEMRFVSTDGGG